jgi:hypothetical protein
METDKKLRVERISTDLPADELEHLALAGPSKVTVDTYWSGDAAPEHRRFSAGLLWSDSELIVVFDAIVGEPLVINPTPGLSRKTIGLWERDVCEIFIAPDESEPRRYFEFEVAPTGEWIDLVIDLTGGERTTDWEYNSGMTAAARIEEGRVLMSMKMPWEAFGRKPDPGDIWLGNIFRCVGRAPDRGYLAWQPTMTEKQNFHVPKAFQELIFT